MSTAEKIFQKAQSLPEQVQDKLLYIAEELARECLSGVSSPLTLHEAAELRGKFATWEEDWDAPGLEAYDRPEAVSIQSGLRSPSPRPSPPGRG